MDKQIIEEQIHAIKIALEIIVEEMAKEAQTIDKETGKCQYKDNPRKGLIQQTLNDKKPCSGTVFC